jgi:hypothetical protein
MITRKQARRWLRFWQSRLLLQRWRIRILFNQDESWDRSGQIMVMPGREEADLTLWEAMPEKEGAYIVAHELLHIVQEPVDVFVDLWAKETLEEEQYELFTELYNNRRERVVDHLTEILADLAQGP